MTASLPNPVSSETVGARHFSSTGTSAPAYQGTPLPTLKTEVIWNAIQSNIVTNKGCKLPCWWGIQPGVTDYQDAIVEFDLFDTNPRSHTIPVIVGNREVSESMREYDYHKGIDRLNWSIAGVDGKVSKITVISTFKDQFGLPVIFRSLGLPEHIYLLTFREPSDLLPFRSTIPFYLFLEYHVGDTHMFIDYYLQANKEEDEIVGCSSDYEILVKIWREDLVEKDYERQQFSEAGIDEIEKLKPLEEVTLMDAQKMAQAFEKNHIVCIHTQIDAW